MFKSSKLLTETMTLSEIHAYNTNGSYNPLVPGRVIAATNILPGATTIPINAKQLCGQPDVMQVSVGINNLGKIEVESDSKTAWTNDAHWIRSLRMSDDCHSHNIQLRFMPSVRRSFSSGSSLETLLLQCVKPISPGQELSLWFSEEILAILQIVFLTPANIQGQKKYVCTKCSAMYESPNPLKLHITLTCNSHPMGWLWKKLSNLITESIDRTIGEFDLKLAPNLGVIKQGNAMWVPTTGLSQTVNKYTPFSIGKHISAFKPFQKGNGDSYNLPLKKENYFYQQWTNSSLLGDYVQISAKTENSYIYDQAQIESLVSSLGKSKHGHTCLYCGKCYSRKYGLKIHIRTHTGYKPLRCKYCLRPFGDPSNLNKHVRLHAAGDTPYRCDFCGKILMRKRDLERHLKSRHMTNVHPGYK